MFITLTLIHQPTGDLTTFSTSLDAQVSTLCSHVYTTFNVPPGNQAFFHNDNQVRLDKTLQEAGLSDGDLISVQGEQENTNEGASDSTAAVPASSRPTANAAGAPPPDAILSTLRADQNFMNRIRQAYPEMHGRIMANDHSVVREIMGMLQGSGAGGGNNFDPMSEDGQKEIEKQIQAENVARNLEAAMEHNPESFGRVVMLFVDCKVNGVPTKAFVDSGAQATIISKACAERCNILRLMDTRFSGVARGVGTATIHGRIHLALLTLDKEVFEISFTVMDSVGGGYDILLGLDMLRKHQAKIDLEDSCLKIGNSSVPFLQEKDIPIAMRSEDNPNPSEHSTTAGSASGPTGESATAPNALAPTGQNTAPAAAVQQLIEMGFSDAEAREALAAAANDVTQAANLLMMRKYGE